MLGYKWRGFPLLLFSSSDQTPQPQEYSFLGKDLPPSPHLLVCNVRVPMDLRTSHSHNAAFQSNALASIQNTSQLLKDSSILTQVGGSLYFLLLSTPSQSDLCAIVSIVLAIMPAPIPNKDADKKREKADGTWHADADANGSAGANGPNIPKRWAGTVSDRLGKDTYSGLWKIKIRAPALEDRVTADVNERRAIGTRVQFCLEENQDGLAAGSTWFELYQGEPSTNGWRQGMNAWEGWDASSPPTSG